LELQRAISRAAGSGVASAPPAFDAFQVERNLQRHNNVDRVPAPRCFG
jgi:hypothetical protein